MRLTGLENFIYKNHNRIALGMIVLFGIMFSLISFINHYTFRTEAYDLGLFNNAVYDYAHFRWNSNSIKQYDNILSDHFTILHIPFAQFSWIFGSYTLLVFQILAILLGAYGAYKFSLLRSNRPGLSLVLLLHFLSIWGIYSALAYEYHDNIIGAMMVPWFFYYFYQKKWLKATAFFIIILISKENMALWAVFLSAGLAIIHYKDKAQLRYALVFGLVAAVYFAVVVKLVIPSLAATERPYDYIGKYAAVGEGFSGIIINCITKPQYIFSLLFENHLHEPPGDGVKSELHWMVLMSGGLLVFLQPVYLLMLIPIYAQKLFSVHYAAWGISLQYSIEFVPILNMALLGYVIKQPTRKGWIIVCVVTALTIFSTVRSFSYRVTQWYNSKTLEFYKKHHYTRHFDVSDAHAALKKHIPANAPLSAHPFLTPHLAFRDYIYDFPKIGNAHYIALIVEEDKWPEAERYLDEIAILKASGEWEQIFYENCILIFRKKNAGPENVDEIKSFEKHGKIKTVSEMY